MSNDDDEAAIEVLCNYYDAISSGSYEAIPPLCSDTFTVISLNGSSLLSTNENIIQAYKNLWTTWKEQGIMRKIGYDRDKFAVIEVQDNVKLIQTRLTNYDQAGLELNCWNCSYVMVREDFTWLISLATTDNASSTSLKHTAS